LQNNSPFFSSGTLSSHKTGVGKNVILVYAKAVIFLEDSKSFHYLCRALNKNHGLPTKRPSHIGFKRQHASEG
jgi:hypothetical protein